MNRSFDNLTFVYARMESLIFGRSLERAREQALSAFDASRPQNALLLGDGDGRFACRALQSNPFLHIDSIDSSASMLRCAKRRIETLDPKLLERYNSIEANALRHKFPVSNYDIVVTQFFLDCFPSKKANALIAQLEATIKPKGKFAYADFSIPSKQPWNPVGQFLIAMLYRCFRLTTDINAKRLPTLEWPKCFVLESKTEYLKGVLTSKIWSKQ